MSKEKHPPEQPSPHSVSEFLPNMIYPTSPETLRSGVRKEFVSAKQKV
jgi:hypothetical protein